MSVVRAPVVAEVIEFAMPAPLLNMNQRLHWRVQRRIARAWRGRTQIAALETLGAVPSARSRPACVVSITLPVPDRRARDPHNYFPTVKHIVDGLVDARVWPDDTPQWVTTTEPTLAIRRPPHEIVTITLTPREPR